ncbi:MAG: Crp/Fnr family transcriptional regulator [Pseudomonadota bacterium]
MLLPNSGFLSEASPKLIEVLESMATEVRLDPGDVLFEKDDEGDALFAVISGTLEASVLSHDGRKLVLDLMRPGALFGEIALFDPGPRTATIAAIEAARLRRLKNADLVRQIEKSPDFAIDMIRLAGQRMRWMNGQLGDHVFLPLPTRLARKMLHLTTDGETTSKSLTMSQTHLADFVGVTREAVSKVLGEWKRLGIVTAGRREIEIVDRAALQRLADYDIF